MAPDRQRPAISEAVTAHRHDWSQVPSRTSHRLEPHLIAPKNGSLVALPEQEAPNDRIAAHYSPASSPRARRRRSSSTSPSKAALRPTSSGLQVGSQRACSVVRRARRLVLMGVMLAQYWCWSRRWQRPQFVVRSGSRGLQVGNQCACSDAGRVTDLWSRLWQPCDSKLASGSALCRVVELMLAPGSAA